MLIAVGIVLAIAAIPPFRTWADAVTPRTLGR